MELVHRDANGAWSVIPFPGYKRRSLFDNPLSIQAFSPFDIYVCGGSRTDPARLLHYSTDLKWTEEPLPSETFTHLGSGESCVIAGGQSSKLTIAFAASVAVGAEVSWVGSLIPTFEPLREGHVEAVMRSDDTPGALLVRESFGPTTKVNASYVNGEWTTFRLSEMDLAKFARTAEGHLYAAGSADGASESPTRLFARGADGKWGDCGTLPGTADQVVGGGVGVFWVGGTRPDGTAYLLDVRETP